MAWDPEEDAVVVADELVKLEKGGLSAQHLDEHFGWGPRRMNPALNYLASKDLVLASRTGHPQYSHASIHRNPRTRRFVREHR